MVLFLCLQGGQLHFTIRLIEIFKKFGMILHFKDDEDIKQDIIITTVMNGRWYGGGFKSAPYAEFDDGYLDLCRVNNLPRRKIFPLLPKYFRGVHGSLDVVTMKKVKELVISSDETFTYGCDGEIFTDKRI